MSRSTVFKQWRLSKSEDLVSFESWKFNIIYTLKKEQNFAPFFRHNVQWLKKKADPNRRGLQKRGDKSGEERADDLEQMLGCVASFCPVIKSKTIVENSRCLEDVWQAIRLHYGIQTSGATFMDFTDIKLSADDKPEDLYQKMASFIDDNLLKQGTDHDGERLGADEVVTPSLENLIVLLWLEKLHPKLPGLVKQKFATQLRSSTLFSIRPEISMSIPALLEEVNSTEEARVMRYSAGNQNRKFNNNRNNGSNNSHNYSRFSQSRRSSNAVRQSPECSLCKQAGRKEFDHWLSSCKFLSDNDKRYLSKSRRVIGAMEDVSDSEETVHQRNNLDDLEGNFEDFSLEDRNGVARRVMIKTCPSMNVHFDAGGTTITLDSGAETDLIRYDVAVSLGLKIGKSVHGCTLADKKTPLNVVGEVHTSFSRDNRSLTFSGLVVKELDVEVLGGIPFMTRNDIYPRPAKNLIMFGDGTSISYSTKMKSDDAASSIRKASILRASESTTIWPGDFLEVKVPDSHLEDVDLAVEPRSSPDTLGWIPAGIRRSVGRSIRIENVSTEPQMVKKHDHICQVIPTFTPQTPISQNGTSISSYHADNASTSIRNVTSPSPSKRTNHTTLISIDPDELLSPTIKQDFVELHTEFEKVFDPKISVYNHAFGKFEAVVNMGAVKPPQRKGRLPQYSRDKLCLLQEHFDNLESQGVVAKPEEVGVNIEYLSPSFLVKKNEKIRLVTAFGEVGKYCKPQPTLLPTIDSTLRTIANWKFLISTDLKSAYYQIPLSIDSMKYCGTATPFKGTRVYTRAAMGLPGSESALEELLCRIVGDLITAGIVAKLADDLYIGGHTEQELFKNWRAVLECFQASNLKLSASKTVIAPKETTILGWVWNQGFIRASSHKISALAICQRPVTVKDMRSFVGAYKVLARVIPNCSHFLLNLTKATAGKSSQQKVVWDESLEASFENAQKHLQKSQSIILPKPEDQLWIVTDGATTNPIGIGATLYAVREGTAHVGGFFSQQLTEPQREKYYPCEVEGLGIAAAIKFFSGFIAQSSHRTKVLTDSKPCRDAHRKLCKGVFSANARLATYLNSISRHHVTVDHISGIANAPADFSSRNPVRCVSDRCQVCLFASDLDNSVVRAISVNDIRTGKVSLPFTSRKAWLATQSECPDLRRVKAHLLQGTRPSKKETKIPNVKRYLNKVDVASDGLVVVRKSDVMAPTREAIVVPVQVISGLVTALHIKLDHPSSNELLTTMERSFYAFNLPKIIEETTKMCSTCASLAKIPNSLIQQQSSDPPTVVGAQFAGDILNRETQKILVLREYVSSYTTTTLVEAETAECLRDNLLRLILDLVPLEGPPSTVRVDSGPGFRALKEDKLLRSHNIQLDLGRTNNPNKNPVAERAIQELEEVIRKHDKSLVKMSPLDLAIVTARLNSKVRAQGLSAREILQQRNQFTQEPIPLNDQALILEKHATAVRNHESSERSKSKSGCKMLDKDIQVGSLVYLFSDHNKHRARDRYLVTEKEGDWCRIRKFVGNQLRALSHKVRVSEIYMVPQGISRVIEHKDVQSDYSFSGSEDERAEESPEEELAEEESSERSSAPLDNPLSERDTPAEDGSEYRTRSGRVSRRPTFLGYASC